MQQDDKYFNENMHVQYFLHVLHARSETSPEYPTVKDSKLQNLQVCFL